MMTVLYPIHVMMRCVIKGLHCICISYTKSRLHAILTSKDTDDPMHFYRQIKPYLSIGTKKAHFMKKL